MRNLGAANGVVFGNPPQLATQAIAVAATVGYSFVVSLMLLKAVDWTWGLRAHEEQEETGSDMSQYGEAAYGF